MRLCVPGVLTTVRSLGARNIHAAPVGGWVGGRVGRRVDNPRKTPLTRGLVLPPMTKLGQKSRTYTQPQTPKQKQRLAYPFCTKNPRQKKKKLLYSELWAGPLCSRAFFKTARHPIYMYSLPRETRPFSRTSFNFSRTRSYDTSTVHEEARARPISPCP